MSNSGSVTTANSTSFASYFSRDNVTQFFQKAQSKVSDFTRGIPAQMNQSNTRAAFVIAALNAIFFAVLKYTFIPFLERVLPENADDSRWAVIGKELTKVAAVLLTAGSFNFGIAYLTRYGKLDRILQLTISIAVVFAYVFTKRLPALQAQLPETPEQQRVRLEGELVAAREALDRAQGLVDEEEEAREELVAEQTEPALAHHRAALASLGRTNVVVETREDDLRKITARRQFAENRINTAQSALQGFEVILAEANNTYTSELQQAYNERQAYLQQRATLTAAQEAAQTAVDRAQTTTNHDLETTSLVDAQAALQQVQQQLNNLVEVQENINANQAQNAVQEATRQLDQARREFNDAQAALQPIQTQLTQAENALQITRALLSENQATVDAAQRAIEQIQEANDDDDDDDSEAVTARDAALLVVEALVERIAALTTPAELSVPTVRRIELN